MNPTNQYTWPRWLRSLAAFLRWLLCTSVFVVFVTVAWRWVMPEKATSLFDLRGALAWLLVAVGADIFALRKSNRT